ncbi:hypothetical protein IZY60_02865 [Lutibacter sp. B2]|nr:hypothetical protein [Lutibacter sp. B2]
MKKTKFLALALAAGIMMMGAGYAAWTDDFTAVNTVNTGTLEVSLAEADNYADIYLAHGDNAFDDTQVNGDWERITDNNDYYNITMKTDTTVDKQVTFNFTNVFPGVTATSYFKLQNSGTVPAAIQTVTVDVTDKDGKTIDANNPANKELYDAMKVFNRFYINRADGTKETIEGSWVTLGELQNELTNKLANGKVVLEGGAQIGTLGEDGTKSTWFSIPKDSLNGDEGEGQNIKVEVRFDFVQSNLVTK